MRYIQPRTVSFSASVLGFGCMRLPTKDGVASSNAVDEQQARTMIRYAIDNGINYIDTAYPYHHGVSEIMVGKALQKGYRNKVALATKSPLWLIKSGDDFTKILEEQLVRLKTDHIDFYLLHAIDREKWKEVVLKHDLLLMMEKAKEQGKIGHCGFSFHDTYETFKTVIDGYDKWEFCQIQYNYMDIDQQAGMKGLAYASTKGIPVIAMEPLLGGKLSNLPKEVQKIIDSCIPPYTAAEWALHWLWSQKDIWIVLSGMSTLDQVKQNIAAANNSHIGLLSTEKLAVIDRLRDTFNMRKQIPCTYCNYCLPCPVGVAIPRNFKFYNDGLLYENVEAARSSFKHFIAYSAKADKCIQCKACEKQCPQKIPISTWLKKVHAVLGEGKSYDTQTE